MSEDGVDYVEAVIAVTEARKCLLAAALLADACEKPRSAAACRDARDGLRIVLTTLDSVPGQAMSDPRVADDLRAALEFPSNEAIDTEDDELGRWDSPNA